LFWLLLMTDSGTLLVSWWIAGLAAGDRVNWWKLDGQLAVELTGCPGCWLQIQAGWSAGG
jgi:hypothetical protein